MSVFLLWHVHHVALGTDGYVHHFENPDEFWADEAEGDDVKLLGVYSSRAKAIARCNDACELEGFSAEPRCFHIGEYHLDQDQWVDGFR